MQIHQSSYSDESDLGGMAALVRDFLGGNVHSVDLPYRLYS
jgi:hypothetical protein